ncbi:MAG: chloride channel protein, partial [Dehalococcoidia bacterium]|nr:chloride channel protein [Dehalococcoidia bacterium]
HGMLGASANAAHYGFASSGTRLGVGLRELPREPVMLVVELIGETDQIESFCRTHGGLIAGKVIVHKPVEHWLVEAGLLVVDEEEPAG